MSWAVFWSLLVGAVLATGGAMLQSWFSARRDDQRLKIERANVRRIEQRDQIAGLLDAGRRWTLNIETLFNNLITDNVEFVQKSEAWAESNALRREFQSALITCRLVATDDDVADQVKALSDQFYGTARTFSPIAARLDHQDVVSIADLDAFRAHLDEASQLLDDVERAAKAMLRREIL